MNDIIIPDDSMTSSKGTVSWCNGPFRFVAIEDTDVTSPPHFFAGDPIWKIETACDDQRMPLTPVYGWAEFLSTNDVHSSKMDMLRKHLTMLASTAETMLRGFSVEEAVNLLRPIYARLFNGSITVLRDDGDVWIAACDDVIQAMNDDTLLDENRDVSPMRAPNTEEFESWLTGDVYGYVVEEFDEDTQEWNEIDALYGIYGIDALRSHEKLERAAYDAQRDRKAVTSDDNDQK